MNDNVRERAKKHYLKMAAHYAATRMAELAPGIIAVEDKSNECDALFDVTMWKYTDEELWAGMDRTKMIMEEQFNVLEGVGSSNPVKTIEAMMGFARRHLSPIGRHSFHDQPIVFDHT
jgi:hypothetical protein